MILTGASDDRARGLRLVKEKGGLTIVQDPEMVKAPFVPQAAIAATQVDCVLALPEIASLWTEKG